VVPVDAESGSVLVLRAGTAGVTPVLLASEATTKLPPLLTGGVALVLSLGVTVAWLYKLYN
jgi:hypothetical protein